MLKNKTRKNKENATKIKEELIPMTEEQLKESIEKLTQIYAFVKCIFIILVSMHSKLIRI